MLAHVLHARRPQVTEIVICGRLWPDEVTLTNLRPERIGPIAGLEAALDYAARNDFEAVLSLPVDTLPLPADLLVRLRGDGPAALRTGSHPSTTISAWTAICRQVR